MINHSNSSIGKEELLAIKRIMQSRLVTAGPENAKLQEEFRKYIGSEYVKLTSSGTMAFFLILQALEIESGDEILMPDYICSDLLGPIQAFKAKPVIYDNRINSWLSSKENILSKVTPKTRVILINHTFGFIFKDIQYLAQQLNRNISIVEDCCHAIISYKNPLKEFTRNHSLCCFYSFNATKLMASGEGGAISSDDEKFIAKLERIKIGDKLSDLSSSIARVQLKRLDFFIERRKYIAEIYNKEFQDLLTIDFFENAGIYFRYPLLITKNDKFWRHTSIAYRKGVDSLVSQQINLEIMPNVKRVYEATVSIPIYPSLNYRMINKIISITKNILQR